MQRNAFELLAAGARSSGKPKSKTQTPSGTGAYATCPLCQRTVPLAFADAHISNCLLSTPARPQQQQHPAASKAAPSGGLQPDLLLPSQRQQPAAAIDIEQQQQHPGTAHAGAGKDGAHAASNVAAQQADREERAADPPPSLGSGASSGLAVPISQDGGCAEDHLRRRAPLQQGRHQQAQPTQPASSGCDSQPARPSAFDVMRQGQLRAASRCHTFFLERTSDGRWLGHWWAKGSATLEQQRLLASSLWATNVSVANANGGSRASSSGGGAGAGGAPGGGPSIKDSLALATNVAPRDGGLVSWSSDGLPSNVLPPEGRWRGSPSALKSALQKAVRLGRGGCAARAALHLAKEDPAQLLRRLSIICVEDSILHPGLPLVVWLMAAQGKGYIMGAAHVSALLCLTYQLATVGVRDGLPEPWDGGGGEAEVGASGGGPQADDPARDLPAAEAGLIRCLLLRASYGGMACDVRLLRGFAAYWSARFRGAAGGIHMRLLVLRGCNFVPQQSRSHVRQVGDAAPGCGAFMPASQLLAEQMAEQTSLQRLATAVRQRLGAFWGGSGADASVVRPQWHVAAEADTPPGSATGGCASSGPTSSRWLQYLCELYDQVPVPGPLSRAASVGPLRRSDVPLSAVDFHVSDVVPQLLARPEVQAAAAASGARGGAEEEQAEEALKSAMWLFRSSTNPKCLLYTLSPCCRTVPTATRPPDAGPSSCRTSHATPAMPRKPVATAACLEHSSLADQVAGEGQARQRLSGLWTVAAPWADRYSVGYIARRFGPL
ncbi:hypothetical protein TSOC_002885 [Tetrabaena socialis]|uniref:UBZ4-type domain-containing protein n=1 Tax=Tetrabaena socialis TaxID=47790 RepID=A0A2J8ACY4_9CHLO|nr:hypothetical protein TSOC_002885 [Tetrabaena socialis]|eukprot:PNH10384.1 hypothetical protein TSOC_002885 [Tetrabaena socialis]